MRIVSINVGRPRLHLSNGATISTAVFKAPVEGPVRVGRLNIEGDRQASLDVHGGVDKAVYAYAQDHYAYWAEATGRDDFSPGQFGENLTVEGLDEAAIHIGETFRVGSVELRVTQPRMPCRNLGIRMADATFPKRFHDSLLSGVYFAVDTEGAMDVDDTFESLHIPADTISVRDLYELTFDTDAKPEDIERVLALPHLAAQWKQLIEGRHATDG